MNRIAKQHEAFTRTVTEFYTDHGRHDLPWRLTMDPYRILVSEIMLQQTQVDRVLPKYQSFLKQYPTVKKLAAASLGDVLREWQGLGYNRRAKMLHGAAKQMVKMHNGKVPNTFEELVALPGIGPYTGGAVMAFAYQVPIPIIETNIRTAYLHHFFHDKTDVRDADIMAHIVETIDLAHPREWYYALMDYGANLKRTIGNQNSRSSHYTRQAAFSGSDREIRGAIIRALGKIRMTRKKLHTVLGFEMVRIDAQIERLKEEGMITEEGRSYMLPE